MLNNKRIEQLESRINEQPCPVCGKMHRVQLTLSSNRQVIAPAFPDGACAGFVSRVKQLLGEEYYKATYPFPPADCYLDE